MNLKSVAVIVGSLRKESFNRKVALNLIDLAPEGLNLEILEIGQLPMYNQDLDDNPPTEWVEFRKRLKSFDAVLFATAEYNRSIPGVLKNAIDVGSRPPGQSIWNGKPGAVISASPGALGGFGANHHLRQCCMAVNIPVMPQPEVYLSKVDQILDEKGKINNDRTKELALKFIRAFADWIQRNSKEA